MRAVTAVLVELTRDVAAQTFAFTYSGQLARQLADEFFGLFDDPWDRRHGPFLALSTDNFRCRAAPGGRAALISSLRGWRLMGLI